MMQHTFWYNVATTSWWTYVGFIFAGFCLYQTTQTKTATLKELVLIPMVMLSGLCFLLVKNFSIPYALLLMLAVLIGTLLSHTYLAFRKAKVCAKTKSVELPGTWLAIALAGVALVAHFGFQVDFLSPVQQQDIPHTFMLLGPLVGLVMGRATYTIRKLN